MLKKKETNLKPTTTYIKLQDAYVSESSKYFGSWNTIGYNMSTSNNVFTYSDPKGSGYSSGTAELASAEAVWQAVPNANLNDCTGTTSKWQLTIAKGGTGNNGAEYDAGVTGGPGGNSDVLVPGFGKLDKDGVVGTAN